MFRTPEKHHASEEQHATCKCPDHRRNKEQESLGDTGYQRL